MINNDVLRRIRFIFDFNDKQMLDIFALVDYPAATKDLHGWLRKDDDPKFVAMSDIQFSLFLNGFIILKRGKKEGVEMPVERRLTNNIIFRKLKIALNLQAEEILDTIQLAGFKLGKHELSAFFRKPDNRQYRLCKDQVLRNFLTGLQLQYRKS